MDSGHVKNHDKDQEPEQSSCEDEEILRFQSFELYRSSDPFINMISIHNIGF
jgi:hypothetical protein